MPNYARADWSPIADAIKGFGTGYANVALKRLELDRKLGKDIYDAAQKESATRLNKAKAEDQELLTAGRKQLSEYFDPAQFSPQQLSSIGADALLGSKSVQDALKGADVAMTAGMKREQYDNGNPATKLSVALNKVVTPYQLDSDTGGVLNKMTGTVTLPEILKGVVEGNRTQGEKGVIDPGDVAQAFQYYVDEIDQYQNPVKRLRRDLNTEKAFYDWCTNTGRKPTRTSLFEYIALFGNGSDKGPVVPAEEKKAEEKKDGGTFDWLLKLFTPSAGGAVTPTVQGANPAPVLPDPVVGRTLPKFANYEEALSALEKGLITQEEFRQIAQSFGGK